MTVVLRAGTRVTPGNRKVTVHGNGAGALAPIDPGGYEAFFSAAVNATDTAWTSLDGSTVLTGSGDPGKGQGVRKPGVFLDGTNDGYFNNSISVSETGAFAIVLDFEGLFPRASEVQRLFWMQGVGGARRLDLYVNADDRLIMFFTSGVAHQVDIISLDRRRVLDGSRHTIVMAVSAAAPGTFTRTFDVYIDGELVLNASTSPAQPNEPLVYDSVHLGQTSGSINRARFRVHTFAYGSVAVDAAYARLVDDTLRVELPQPVLAQEFLYRGRTMAFDQDITVAAGVPVPSQHTWTPVAGANYHLTGGRGEEKENATWVFHARTPSTGTFCALAKLDATEWSFGLQRGVGIYFVDGGGGLRQTATDPGDNVDVVMAFNVTSTDDETGEVTFYLDGERVDQLPAASGWDSTGIAENLFLGDINSAGSQLWNAPIYRILKFDGQLSAGQHRKVAALLQGLGTEEYPVSLEPMYDLDLTVGEDDLGRALNLNGGATPTPQGLNLGTGYADTRTLIISDGQNVTYHFDFPNGLTGSASDGLVTLLAGAPELFGFGGTNSTVANFWVFDGTLRAGGPNINLASVRTTTVVVTNGKAIFYVNGQFVVELAADFRAVNNGTTRRLGSSLVNRRLADSVVSRFRVFNRNLRPIDVARVAGVQDLVAVTAFNITYLSSALWRDPSLFLTNAAGGFAQLPEGIDFSKRWLPNDPTAAHTYSPDYIEEGYGGVLAIPDEAFYIDLDNGGSLDGNWTIIAVVRIQATDNLNVLGILNSASDVQYIQVGAISGGDFEAQVRFGIGAPEQYQSGVAQDTEPHVLWLTNVGTTVYISIDLSNPQAFARTAVGADFDRVSVGGLQRLNPINPGDIEVGAVFASPNPTHFGPGFGITAGQIAANVSPVTTLGNLVGRWRAPSPQNVLDESDITQLTDVRNGGTVHMTPSGTGRIVYSSAGWGNRGTFGKVDDALVSVASTVGAADYVISVAFEYTGAASGDRLLSLDSGAGADYATFRMDGTDLIFETFDGTALPAVVVPNIDATPGRYTVVARKVGTSVTTAYWAPDASAAVNGASISGAPATQPALTTLTLLGRIPAGVPAYNSLDGFQIAEVNVYDTTPTYASPLNVANNLANVHWPITGDLPSVAEALIAEAAGDFDFSASGTVTTSGTEITSIGNSSAGSFTAATNVASGAGPELVTAGQNGLNYAQFDDSNVEYLQGTMDPADFPDNAGGGHATTIFFVGAFDPLITNGAIIDLSSNANTTNVGEMLFRESGNLKLRRNSPVVDTVPAVPDTNTDWRVISAKATETNSFLRVNGVQVAQRLGVVAPHFELDNFRIGSLFQTLVYAFGGAMGQVIVFSRDLPDSEMAAVEAFLAEKWGTQ